MSRTAGSARVITACIHGDESASLSNNTVTAFPSSNPISQLLRLKSSIPHFYSLANDLFVTLSIRTTWADVADLLDRSRAVDAALLSWSTNTPESWRYTSIPWSSIQLGIEDFEMDFGIAHVYNDVSIAHAWNLYRCGRLFVQAIVLICLAWTISDRNLDSLTVSQVEEAQSESAALTRNIDTLAEDICASVPAHLGQVSITVADCERNVGRLSRSTISELPETMSSATKHEENIPVRAGQSSLLPLWPLFVVYAAHTTTEHRKQWALKLSSYWETDWNRRQGPLGQTQGRTRLTFVQVGTFDNDAEPLIMM